MGNLGLSELLVIAGDLYDGEWKDYSTGLLLGAELLRLREVGTRVVWIRGNHDAAATGITRALRMPDHVHELSTRAPETMYLEALGVAVHGQGFPTRATTEDLAARYPAAASAMFNIGVLHSSITGRPGHEPYAPCSLATLTSKGYDYWALGHVHAREVLCETPWIVFPGNLQGRHIRETGPKGATLARVEDGRVASVEHRALDVVRWSQCTVDASNLACAAELPDLTRDALGREVVAAEGRLVAARIRITGATAAHAELVRHGERWEHELRALPAEMDADIFVEKVRLETRDAVDLALLRERDDMLGELYRAVSALRADPAARAELLSEVATLVGSLPAELREIDGRLLSDPAMVDDVLERFEHELLPLALHDAGAT
jgi:DNA repair exonuclease SbcCD nuclease subunit